LQRLELFFFAAFFFFGATFFFVAILFRPPFFEDGFV
jgi:hypothetical protein